MTQVLDSIAPSFDVRGMTIAMTGGGMGLGRAALDVMMQNGLAKAVVLDIREDKLAELKAAYGDRVEIIPFNLGTARDADYDAVAAQIRKAVTDPATGVAHLDMFWGNAGVLKATSKTPYDATKDFDLTEIFASFAINAAANACFFQRLKPLLVESDGRFLFTTSPTAGRTTDTKYPWYGAAKAYQEQAMGCLGTGNPELPVMSFDPGRLDGTGVRAEAYPDELPGAQPAPPDILAPLLLMISRTANIEALRGQVIQVNNNAAADDKGRKINPRALYADGQEGFDVTLKLRPLASMPGSGLTVADHYNTAHSRALIGAAPLEPYDSNGKTLKEVIGLPSQQIGNKLTGLRP